MNKFSVLVVEGVRTHPNFILASQQSGKRLILSIHCKYATPLGFLFFGFWYIHKSKQLSNTCETFMAGLKVYEVSLGQDEMQRQTSHEHFTSI